MERVVVEVSDLEFGYRDGGFHLHVDALSIAAGQSVVVVGPSGTGKTTLLNLLAGILVPPAGRIEIEGVDMTKIGTEDRQDFRAVKMGLVFQEFELLEYLSALDNVLLPYRISPVLALDDAARERASRLLTEVGLGDKQHRYPRQLSQGERQRAAVCRALVAQPTLLLADEPTGNLDPANRDHVMDTLFQYQKANGVPLIVVTHEQELIGRFEQLVDVRSFAR